MGLYTRQGNTFYGIDLIKGLCILLVVVHHTLTFDFFPQPVAHFCGAVFLNSFFVVSGFLYGRRAEGENRKPILHKFWRLIIPYAGFSVLAILWHGILAVGLGCREMSEIWFGWELVLRDVLKTVSFTGIGTLWFLPVLFLSYAFLVLCVRVLPKRNALRTVLLLLLAAALDFASQQVMTIRVPGSSVWAEALDSLLITLHRTLYGSAFTLAGFLLYDFRRIRMPGRKWIHWGSAVLLVAACIWGGSLLPDVMYRAVLCVTFVWVILLVCDAVDLPALRTLAAPVLYCGRESLSIMIYHYVFLLPPEKMLLRQIPLYVSMPPMQQGLVLLAVNLLTTCLVSMLMKRTAAGQFLLGTGNAYRAFEAARLRGKARVVENHREDAG